MFLKEKKKKMLCSKVWEGFSSNQMIMSVSPDLGTCTAILHFLSFLETLNMSIKTLQLRIKAIFRIKDTCLNGFKTVWTTVLKGQQSMAQHPVGSQ